VSAGRAWHGALYTLIANYQILHFCGRKTATESPARDRKLPGQLPRPRRLVVFRGDFSVIRRDTGGSAHIKVFIDF